MGVDELTSAAETKFFANDVAAARADIDAALRFDGADRKANFYAALICYVTNDSDGVRRHFERSIDGPSPDTDSFKFDIYPAWRENTPRGGKNSWPARNRPSPPTGRRW